MLEEIEELTNPKIKLGKKALSPDQVALKALILNSLDTIRDVCLTGPGHYLGSEQTLALMQKEYVYPLVANRMSPKEWVEAGRPDLLETATRRKNEILSTYHPDYLPREIDDVLRRDHRIFLPREVMEPGDPRWS